MYTCTGSFLNPSDAANAEVMRCIFGALLQAMILVGCKLSCPCHMQLSVKQERNLDTARTNILDRLVSYWCVLLSPTQWMNEAGRCHPCLTQTHRRERRSQLHAHNRAL
jgi:hypothetical protein